AETGERIRLRALLDPCGRDDLMVMPFALVKIEQRETGEVARAHLERIGRIDRVRAGDIFAVGRSVVLHADRPGDLALEGVEDRRAGGMLVDRAERVEVPVVVVPEGARLVTEARRAARRHRRRLEERGVVDTGARL